VAVLTQLRATVQGLSGLPRSQEMALSVGNNSGSILSSSEHVACRQHWRRPTVSWWPIHLLSN